MPRPLAQLHHLEEMGPVVLSGDRALVRMSIAGSTTVWLWVFGTDWFEQVETLQPNPT